MEEKIKKWINCNSVFYGAQLSLISKLAIFAISLIYGQIANSLIIRTVSAIYLLKIFDAFLFGSAVKDMFKSPDTMSVGSYGKQESLADLVTSAGALLIFLFIAQMSLQAKNILIITEKNIFPGALLLIFFAWILGIIKKINLNLALRFNFRVYEKSAISLETDSRILFGVVLYLVIKSMIYSVEISFAFYISDLIFSMLISGYYAFSKFGKLKDSLVHLLDSSLSEDFQLELLSIVAENINKMCEFRAIRSHRNGEVFFIEFDIVLPYDYTLSQVKELERLINESVKNIYEKSVVRIYAIPCKKDCKSHVLGKCPVIRIGKLN